MHRTTDQQLQLRFVHNFRVFSLLIVTTIFPLLKLKTVRAGAIPTTQTFCPASLVFFLFL